MKVILPSIAFLLTFCSLPADHILRTENYIVTVKVQCPEGTVSCKDVVIYVLKKNGKEKIELTGRTLHSYASDGITPTAFHGYESKPKRGIHYQILESGQYIVRSRNNRLIVDERGTWDLQTEPAGIDND